MNDLSDLAFFTRLMQCGSLTATAQELGITPPAVSRRLSALEKRLGVRLLNRTTRTLALTHEGERYLSQGQRILDDLAELERELTGSQSEPQGLLRVNATLGFGRRHVAPAVSAFVRTYPKTEVQLQLSDRMPALTGGAFDVSIRFGEPPEARLVARKIVANRRVLCAAPSYLDALAPVTAPRELSRNACIVVRENQEAYGIWQLHAGSRQETVKVGGALATNDGETAVNWCLEGHGILLRSLWDVAPYLQSGRLRQVLPEWQGAPADIWALYPPRLNLSAKVRAFVDFLTCYFANGTGGQG
ncbi:transcriptional regulator, LysR family [Pseudogulbenkiania sp. NH8B]|uniref:LysR family transcriptional regulator n=1 Tax=Pseudogulbenkiania sp. (strain NH8B) TaxID=748280 RepID=UPI0002279E57|nr:LysR family transcriptional regulator [Pseudogulbenkiania sp. NH8B]BAK76627.1 transcriptional regulator, LysR family [Pseudogulbenkiania sp. NH8B]